jgi:citrate synthase
MESEIQVYSSITKAVKGEKFLMRGYEFEDLAINTSTLEETFYLLLKSELPSPDELNKFIRQISLLRTLPDKLKECVENIPTPKIL